MTHKNRWHRIVAISLAISYGLGSPIGAILEYLKDFFSKRFDLPSELIYATFIIQFICAFGVLSKRYARWSSLCLTATTIGTIYVHFRIGSPSASIIAFAYTGLQIWFWYSLRKAE